MVGLSSLPNNPLVAIITRTKNRSLLLRRAVESILNQTYKNYVHIIINDGDSFKPITLAGGTIVESINSNGRMEYGTNVGVEIAKRQGADLITLLDDDDTWSPEYLRIMINEMKLYRTSCIVCRSNVVHEEIDGNTITTLSMEPANTRMPELGILPITYLVDINNNFGVNQFMYRTDILPTLPPPPPGSGLYYDESLRVYGDWDFNLKVIAQTDIAVIPNYLAFYHHRDGFNSINDSSNNLVREIAYTSIVNKHLRDPQSMFAPLFKDMPIHKKLDTAIDQLLLLEKKIQKLKKANEGIIR